MRPILEELRQATGVRLRSTTGGPSRPTATLATSTMTSPVVIGVKRAAADRLRDGGADRRLSWADSAAGRARCGSR
ncbi:hypothetical protein Dvina_22990 [Dactylosporangium vinaceum]|uniref:Uncharacterized protein n=1 Tax=Dactylosporangium vinaceum TaxID=53362 RepID=A0ABV5MR11_9ACTN|nr:hypothetical protein [Dactylosporangium vinaceum]UAC00662.1 hypothetical protein Dvina_22990 [Dactylosporangium vinaceum]